MTANVGEIIENVIISEFKVEEEGRKRNPKIDQRETIMLETKPVKESIESAVFNELKRRISEGDTNALSILVTAKERVKHDLPIYANTLKLTLLALKPFYLIALVDILTQPPMIV
jgi:hypothetical protein